MAVHPFRSEASTRSGRMLRTALGSSIAAWLEDPAVIEVMLNPDGRLWVDRLGEGISDTGEILSISDGERIVRLVAHHVGVEVHARSPRVSAELPDTGERFEGLLQPVVAAPTFAIRKPAVAIFTLEDYADAAIMSRLQAAVLRKAVTKDQRGSRVHVVALSCRLQMLDDCFLADTQNSGDFVGGFASGRPQYAFTLPVGKDWSPRSWPYANDTPRGSQGKCANQFSDGKHMMGQHCAWAHDEGT